MRMFADAISPPIAQVADASTKHSTSVRLTLSPATMAAERCMPMAWMRRPSTERSSSTK